MAGKKKKSASGKKTKAPPRKGSASPATSKPQPKSKQPSAKQSEKKTKPESRRLSELLMETTTAEQMQEITANLSAAASESQKLLKAMTTKPQTPNLNPSKLDPLDVGGVFGRVGTSLAKHPDRIMRAHMELWQGYMGLWQSMLPKAPDTPVPNDRRFSDVEWSQNPYFDFIRKSYDLNSKWLMSLVDMATDIDEHDQKKASFFTQQAVDAFSPTNFFVTNPTAIKTMIETNGESVLNGIRQMSEDLKRGDGQLSISQTDETPFVLGENVATAPGKVVYRNTLFELLQFSPGTETVYERPLLMFPPWINKFYIMDLREENSMIRWLVSEGFTVFVVSWRSADDTTKNLDWDDYVRLGAFAALDAVSTITGQEKVNTVGYCIGGTMLTSALAYMGQVGDDRVNSATYFASQSDFSEAGDLMLLADEPAIRFIESIIEENDGLMPGEVMAETFNYLRPVDLVWRYVVDNYMLGKKPRPFDLLYWNADQTNIPGPTHLTYLSRLYRDNAMARGDFEVLGKTISLSDIEIPVMFQASRQDHIAPYKSIYKGALQFGGPTEFVLAGSGHIAGVINHPSAQKYQHWTNSDMPDSADDWLDGATETAGSWWPHWSRWLAEKSGDRVAAKPVDDKGLGEAPGGYVKMRLKELKALRASQ